MTTTRRKHPAKLHPQMGPEIPREASGTSSRFIDKALFDAFTVRTIEDREWADSRIQDLNGQCCEHIYFLADLYKTHQNYEDEFGYECDHEQYTDLIMFLAGIGTSLTTVSDKMGHIFLQRDRASSEEVQSDVAKMAVVR